MSKRLKFTIKKTTILLSIVIFSWLFLGSTLQEDLEVGIYRLTQGRVADAQRVFKIMIKENKGSIGEIIGRLGLILVDFPIPRKNLNDIDIVRIDKRLLELISLTENFPEQELKKGEKTLTYFQDILPVPENIISIESEDKEKLCQLDSLYFHLGIIGWKLNNNILLLESNRSMNILHGINPEVEKLFVERKKIIEDYMKQKPWPIEIKH
jgi:hypothetical protein